MRSEEVDMRPTVPNRVKGGECYDAGAAASPSWKPYATN